MIFTIVFDFLTILYIDIFVLSEKKKTLPIIKSIIARNLDYRDASTRVLVRLFTSLS